jgi:excinuclease ABC subunit C
LEFEAASAAHARLERLKAVQGRIAEIVHRIDQLNGLLLQPSHLPGHIALFRIAGGMLHGPIGFDLRGRALKPERKPSQNAQAPTQSVLTQSMEARIKELLRTAEPAAPKSAQEWMEHLAILKRWYYRTNKVGEMFFEDGHGALPMRRVVRAVGRVLKGEKPAGDLSETAGDYWIFRSKEAGL